MPLVIRTAGSADLIPVSLLVHAAELRDDPAAVRYPPEEFAQEWADPRLHAWVAELDGELCGYATLREQLATGRLYADAYTHPEYTGQGVATALLDHAEAQADHVPAGATRLVLVNYAPVGAAAEALLTQRGYALVHVYFRMHRRLTDLSPAVVPDGIRFVAATADEADLARVHECIEDAFVDHADRARRTFEDWRGHMMYDGFDPTLWTLAEHDGALVGASLCRLRGEVGEVDQLGVVRAWRGRGLGRALLLHSFGALAARGAASVGLGVDSTSPTGADRLYASAGMVVTVRHGRFERELRAGNDLMAASIAAERARLS
jgi:mycothiol synthase